MDPTICCKHKVPGQGASRLPNKHLHRELGLVHLQSRMAGFPCANA